MKLRVAVFDPSLRATIVSRKKLYYRAGADPSLDRPRHVRSGSGLAWIGTKLVLIQDDANFVAIVDPATGRAESITLPAGKRGRRQFDDLRGNKKHKFDFEACCAVDTRAGPAFIAFGSGTKSRRRHILVIDEWNRPDPRVRIVNAAPLYRLLKATVDFAGSDMNIEGVLAIHGVLRLFGRGNGRRRGKRVPVNATCELSLRSFLAYLAHPSRKRPRPRRVEQFHLGELDGLSLGFTDVAVVARRVIYTAAAEASKDASDDGRVTGSVIGVLPARGAARYAPIRNGRGVPISDKVEGITTVPRRSGRVYVVVDPDDPRRPSELCEIRLTGW